MTSGSKQLARRWVGAVTLTLALAGCVAETGDGEASGVGSMAVGTVPEEAPSSTPSSDGPGATTETTEAPGDLALVDDGDDGDDGTVSTDDAVGCTRIDPETIEIDVVNNSAETSTYWLTVGYFDETGQRLADSTEVISEVRPGERAVDAIYVFEATGSCEVLDVDRVASDSEPGELADVSACQITGADVFDDVAATVSATNSSSEPSDYDITVAFIDPSGVRRGTGSAFIQFVRPGETAPSDIFTTVDHQPDFVCEVVAVNRRAS